MGADVEEARWLPYPFPYGTAPERWHKQVGYRFPAADTDAAQGYAYSIARIHEWVEELDALASTLIGPVWHGDGYLVGWRPMTDAERARSEAASKRAKEAAAKRRMKKEERERAEYERLARKFGNDQPTTPRRGT